VLNVVDSVLMFFCLLITETDCTHFLPVMLYFVTITESFSTLGTDDDLRVLVLKSIACSICSLCDMHTHYHTTFM